MQDVKNHAGLVDALYRCCASCCRRARPAAPGHRRRRPAVAASLAQVAKAGAARMSSGCPARAPTWPTCMHGFDVFALPSLAEGTPVTCSKRWPAACRWWLARRRHPRSGRRWRHGMLVPPAEPTALAAALARYVQDPALRARGTARRRARASKRVQHGRHARRVHRAVRQPVCAARRWRGCVPSQP